MAKKKLKWDTHIVAPILAAVFFLLSLFAIDSTAKPLVLALLAGAIVTCFIRGSALQERITWPVLFVFAWTVMNGVSTLYAISGKFALREFLKIMAGFCVFLLVLAWGKGGKDRGRMAGTMLEGASALGGLLSIDMLSTRFFSGAVYRFLANFTTDYAEVSEKSVEAGVRMNTYTNPNVFAGIAGLGVLLALELALTTEEEKKRRFHLVCLFTNALSFLLAFSMGASAAIALSFLVFLFLERRERKGGLLVLMVETFLLALAAAFPIFLTAFDTWSGVQPVPLLCTLGGAALLCVADQFLGQPLADRLEAKGKLLPVIIVVVLALLAGFGALSVNVTGPADLAAGEALRRADYPAPGTYTLKAEADGRVNVTITSQNQAETMMHTSTRLYSGPADGAAFTVPEDSLVVYFDLSAAQDLTLTSVTYSGSAGSGSLKLDYKLLPGFIANRLQGLFANQNAIQRTVFFADGMKLFRQGPVFGLGLGTYESAICSVQSFFYETKYAHNHYIETLVTTGVVGLVLFVGMLGLCAAALWKGLRREEGSPLLPGLCAALVFMAAHGGVEVIFSSCYYLPVALGVLALICLTCGEELPFLPDREQVRTGIVIAMAGLMLVFAVTLYLNMRARDIALNSRASERYTNLERADKLDLYEWADYELTYIYMARGIDQVAEAVTYAKANEYARHLAGVKSNSIPPYLAEYYFSTGQREPAYRVLEQYVDYVSSSDETWQTTFNLLAAYSEDTQEHKAEVAKLYEQFQTWNTDHMGSLTLTDVNREYLATVVG